MEESRKYNIRKKSGRNKKQNKRHPNGCPLFWVHSTKMQLKKSRRRRVCNQGVSLGWNHHEMMYGINPKENTPAVMTCTLRVITDT